MITSPLPPSDAVMPDIENTFTIVWGIFALAAIAHAIWVSYRKQTTLPLAIIVGATLAMGAEGLVVNYMHVWYPAIGQINAYHSFNQSIPLFVSFAYVFFFAPWILMLMNAFEQGMTVKRFWHAYLGAVIGVIGYEASGLSLDLWSYYGMRPLLVGELPMAYAFINATLIIIPAVTFYRLKEHIFGWRTLLVVAFMAAQVSGIEMFIGYPNYVAINSDVSLATGNIAALLSIAAALSVMWICAKLVCVPQSGEEQ